MSEHTRMPVMILEWKPMNRNTLFGFAKLQLGALTISDCPVHETAGRKWVGLPSKPMIDGDGNAKRDDAGKLRYAPLLQWATKAASDRFSDSVIAALEEKHPDAFK
jgi:hypothetical protein